MGNELALYQDFDLVEYEQYVWIIMPMHKFLYKVYLNQ